MLLKMVWFMTSKAELEVVCKIHEVRRQNKEELRRPSISLLYSGVLLVKLVLLHWVLKYLQRILETLP